MKKLISFVAGIAIAFAGMAQTGGKIAGKIKDGGNQKVIQAASISLVKAKDSSLVKVAVSDSAGNFLFENLKDGNYRVVATSIGHAKTFSDALAVSGASQLDVGTLQLVALSSNLKEVTVSAKKPMIERKADRTILNVDASVTSAGATALEVLEKAPGVMVDKDGNVSLKGKQGVLIMIDGKPSYLSGPDLTNLLRSMPSNVMDQVEVMTNPSAKYDAAGNAGIINIKTKKNKQVGFNGNLTTSYGQGIYPKSNNSLNLNYRKNKLNLFSTMSGNYRENYQELNIFRRYTNPDKTTMAIFEQTSFDKRENKNYNVKIGADYYLNKKTTLGVVVSGGLNINSHDAENTSYLQNSGGVVDSIVYAKNDERNEWRNKSVNLNMRHVLDTSGAEITADVDYLNYDSKRNQYFNNLNYTPHWTLKYADPLRGDLPTDITIYSVKTDYTKPLKKGAKLEAGLKSSFIRTENVAGYFNINNGVETPDYEKTNSFDYKENINAGYLNYSRTFKKWSMQTGLRLENTNYSGFQYGNPTQSDSSFSNDYTSLFPTLFVAYNPSEKNNFSFSYGRRITRPSYEDLNPFLFFLDKYTYGQGNPFLRPQYSHVLEVNHTFRQFLTTTLSYTNTKNLFSEIFEQKGFATVVNQGNYGRMQNMSLSVSAQIPVTKWWNMNVYTESQWNRFDGLISGKQQSFEGIMGMVNASNNFKFKKGWAAELSGWYRTRAIEGQMIIKSLGQASAGVSKQVIKNKGTIKLNVRDIFFTQRPRGEINFQNTEARFRQQGDNRFATLSFSYRFGKPIKGLQKRKTGGAGDEQNRVKGGS